MRVSTFLLSSLSGTTQLNKLKDRIYYTRIQTISCALLFRLYEMSSLCVRLCVEGISDDVNPFRIPLHYNNLFQMMNKERSRKKLVCFLYPINKCIQQEYKNPSWLSIMMLCPLPRQEHQRKMALPIHKKVTHTSRMTQSRLMEEVKERESNTAVSRTPQQENPSRRIYMLKGEKTHIKTASNISWSLDLTRP